MRVIFYRCFQIYISNNQIFSFMCFLPSSEICLLASNFLSKKILSSNHRKMDIYKQAQEGKSLKKTRL